MNRVIPISNKEVLVDMADHLHMGADEQGQLGAGWHEACERQKAERWLANAKKVSRTRDHAGIRAVEAEAMRLPRGVVRITLKRYEPAPQLRLPGRALLMGLLIPAALWAVIIVAVWHQVIWNAIKEWL